MPQDLSKPLNDIDTVFWEVVDDALEAEPEVIEDDSFVYGWNHNDKDNTSRHPWKQSSQIAQAGSNFHDGTWEEIELADIGLKPCSRDISDSMFIDISDEPECTLEKPIAFLAGALVHKELLNLKDTSSEKVGKSDRQTTLQVAMNLMNCIVGAGVLSLPFAFREGGSFMGFILAGVSVLMTMTLWMIGHILGAVDHVADRAGIPRSSRNWTMLGTMVFGPRGRHVIPIVFVLDLYPCVVTYMIMAADNSHMFSEIYFEDVSLSQHICGLGALVLALLFVPTRYFSIFSALGIIAQVLCLLGLCATGIELRIAEPEAKVETAFLKPGGALGAAGIVIFLFVAHAAVPMLYQSMENREDWPRACMMGGSGAAIFYFCVGVLGYSIFGESTLQVFTINLGRDRHLEVLKGPLPEYFNEWLGPVLGGIMALKLLVTFPVYARPVLDYIEECLGIQEKPASTSLVKVFYTLACTSVAVFFRDHVAFVMEMVGCVIHTTLVVILPVILYTRVCKPTFLFKVLLWSMFTAFLIYMPCGMTQIVQKFMEPCCECGECSTDSEEQPAATGR